MNKARKKETTVEAIYWHYFKSKEGRSPVKLKVTYERKTKNYPIQHEGQNLFLTKDQWESISSRKTKGQNRTLMNHIDAVRVQALSAAESARQGGRPFSFGQFEKEFFAKETNKGFLSAFKRYLDKILAEERIGTYRTYKCAYDAFKSFLGEKDLSPYEITPDLLKEFERYLIKDREAGHTTIGIYARTLRIIYNICADEDQGLKQFYPFGSDKRGRFRISDSRKGKKKGDALTPEQLRKFISSDPENGSPKWEAKLYWLFSFYCQGMNFRDICNLRYSNIDKQAIRYVRHKTKRTEDYEIMEIPITEPIQEIISTLGNPEMQPKNYVFPVLNQEIKDPLIIEANVLQKTKITNKWLKKLCADCGIPEMTTYWSRHTYASLLKDSGVSIEMIRELLGHSDMKTTEHYLKRFDLEKKRGINEKLKAFYEG